MPGTSELNPPISISDVPADAKSLALIMDDPDAPMGTFVHWVVWNIPADTTELQEGSLPTGAIEGINSSRKNDYVGPCPPSGTHHYRFHLYALDTVLDLSTSAGRGELVHAMEGHILSEGELVGLYQRGA